MRHTPWGDWRSESCLVQAGRWRKLEEGVQQGKADDCCVCTDGWRERAFTCPHAQTLEGLSHTVLQLEFCFLHRIATVRRPSGA